MLRHLRGVLTSARRLRPSRTATSSTLELAGVGLVAAGAWVLAPWLGLMLAGVGLATFGWVLEPPRRPERDQ